MKKTTLAVIIALSGVLAMNVAQATDWNGPGNVSVQATGGIHNAISTTAVVTNAEGSVSSFAGSTGSSSGEIGGGVIHTPANSGHHTGTVVGSVNGNVATATTGYVGVVTSGTGASGTADMYGWSDAGTSGNFDTTIGYGANKVTADGGGSVDSGRPTHLLHGPDVQLSAEGGNGYTQAEQAVGASAGSGGSFEVTATSSLEKGKSASVADTKKTSTYAYANSGAVLVDGAALGGGAIHQLNAGADSNAYANGDWKIELNK